jgi:hypothetical protein
MHTLSLSSCFLTLNQIKPIISLPSLVDSLLLPLWTSPKTVFLNASEQLRTDLPLTCYSHAKKKGRHHTHNAGISPHNANEFANAG